MIDDYRLLMLTIIEAANAYLCWWLLLLMPMDVDDYYSWLLMLMTIHGSNEYNDYNDCWCWYTLMIVNVNDLSVESSVANHVPKGSGERFWTNWSCLESRSRAGSTTSPPFDCRTGPSGGCEAIAPRWSVMAGGHQCWLIWDYGWSIDELMLVNLRLMWLIKVN